MKKSVLTKFLTLLLGMLIFAACAGDTKNESDHSDFIFEITNEQTVFSADDGERLLDWYRSEDGTICTVIGKMSYVNNDEKTMRLVTIPIDGEAVWKQIYSSSDILNSTAMYINQNGNIILATVKDQFSPLPLLDFYEYSSDLELLREAHLDSDIASEIGSVMYCKAFDGIFFIICQNGIFAVDSDFVPKGFVEMGLPSEENGYFIINGIEKGSDGGIYAYCTIKDKRKLLNSMYDTLIKIDPQTLESRGEIQYDSDYAQTFYTGDENYLFYTSNNDNFYGMRANGKFDKLFTWTDSPVDNNMFYSSVQADGKFYLLQADGTDIDLIEFEKASQSSDTRTVLTLTAVGGLKTEWREAVREFNSTNKQYKITADVINHGDDAIDAFDLAVISDTVGDIIVPPDNNDTYISKGLYADLGTFLDSDSDLKREDFFPPVLSAMENENREIFELWTAFSIDTSVAPEQLYGGDNGLSYDEIIRLTGENPDKLIHPSMTDSLDTLRWLLRYNFDYFVNMEKGECYFNSEEIKKVLEFSARAPLYVPFDVNRDSLARFIDGKGLLYDMRLFGVDDYISLRDGIFGGYFDVNFVGMPTPNGGAVNVLAGDGYKISINAGSDHKEEAWNFIRTLPMRNGDFYTRTSVTGFAAVESVFDAEAEKICTENEQIIKESGEDHSNTKFSFEGMSFYIRLADREDFDKIRQIIYSSEYVTEFDPYVMAIITEEAAAYFSGAKSVDKVMENIQNRANIYCSERT
ncbi:MAG: extracellular solute-binding protein [Oscillospiraceae bacterium]|nr:extracellular solute-binding protein [Oscillospiraceae bacterium]